MAQDEKPINKGSFLHLKAKKGVREMSKDEFAELADEHGKKLGKKLGDSAYDLFDRPNLARKKFELNKIEYESAKKFAEEHVDCQPKGCTGVKFEYTFVDSGLGPDITIKCLVCGKEEFISDCSNM